VASALLVTLLVIALKTTKVPVNPTGKPLGVELSATGIFAASTSSDTLWPTGKKEREIRLAVILSEAKDLRSL